MNCMFYVGNLLAYAHEKLQARFVSVLMMNFDSK